MNKLFISDLDGTIAESGLIPSETEQELQRLIDTGVNVTIATARGYRSTMGVLGSIRFQMPIILLNGSLIVAPDGAVIRDIKFEIFDAQDLNAILEKSGVGYCEVFTCGLKDWVVVRGYENDFLKWTIERNVYFKAQEFLEDAENRLDVSPTRFIVPASIATITELRRLLSSKSKYNFYAMESFDYEGYGWLEISPKTANKGDAIKWLCEHNSFSLPDVVYYGDGANDLNAFSVVGEAVAVENSVPVILEISDRIIGPVKKSSVVNDIRQQIRE